MYNKYIGLRVYNNSDIVKILTALEKYGYRWNSGNKPTELYGDTHQGVLYINPKNKTICRNHNAKHLLKYCEHYIKVIK